MSKKRIAANAAATYLQSLLSVILGMFSIRWIYLALGKENFGLFSAVGAILGFIGFFNSVLNHSNARFFALAIGEGRKHGSDHGSRELNEWFNTSFSVHLLLAVCLCSVMAFVGEFLIRGGVLVIPDGMEENSLIVFRISLFAMFTTLLHMPFNSLYTAKQLIFVRNFTGMLQTILHAAEAWWILHYSGNRFVAHSALMTSVHVLAYGILVGIAFRAFPECRLRVSLWFDRERIRKMLSYSMYAFCDAIGGCLHKSGCNLVVNANYGPAANAVVGVGSKLSGKLGGLSKSVMSAISPEIVSRVGSHDMARAERLASLSCFIAAFPVCLIGIPCLFWVEDLLRVFLVNPPEGSDVVVVFLVVNSLLSHSSSGYQMLVLASGNVRGLQLSSAILKASSMLLLWVLLKTGVPFLASVGIAWILPQIAISTSRIWFAKSIVGINFRRYARAALLPMSGCIAFSALFSAGLRSFTGASFWWMFPSMCLNAVFLVFFVFRFHPDEMIRAMPGKILARLRKKIFQ